LSRGNHENLGKLKRFQGIVSDYIQNFRGKRCVAEKKSSLKLETDIIDWIKNIRLEKYPGNGENVIFDVRSFVASLNMAIFFFLLYFFFKEY